MSKMTDKSVYDTTPVSRIVLRLEYAPGEIIDLDITSSISAQELQKLSSSLCPSKEAEDDEESTGRMMEAVKDFYRPMSKSKFPIPDVNHISMDYPEQIRAARSACGYSQKRLSEITEIDQSDISKIERGAANPSVATLKRIASGLGGKLQITIDFTQRTVNGQSRD